MELPRLEALSEVTLTDYNDWKVRFRDYVVLTRLKEEIPSVLGRQAELRAALAPPWSKLWLANYWTDWCACCEGLGTQHGAVN